ncbi:MAG: hypothetical protein KatS3mg008_0798 [Acidimicrobiales bacterium]|nr:MAG: hypothetical protein KatS3mg008_0798 [Acidimicrobiales bacterium]
MPRGDGRSRPNDRAVACPTVLPVSDSTVRIFLHVLAASVWVGGQLTVAGLLPVLRRLGADAPRQVARRFGVIAWSAFVVLVATGIWNLLEVDLSDTSPAYHATLGLKIGLVALSGVGAAVHSLGKSKAALALGGAVGFLAAIGALFSGIMLTGR